MPALAAAQNDVLQVVVGGGMATCLIGGWAVIRAQLRLRSRRTLRALQRAATDDDRFEPEMILATARAYYATLLAGDPRLLRRALLGRRFGRRRPELDAPTFGFIGLSVPEDARPQVIVRVTTTAAIASRTTKPVQAYWTLELSELGWRVVRAEPGGRGEYHLDEQLVAHPHDEEHHLHDAAIAELAAADRVPQLPWDVIEGAQGKTAEARLRDLSLLDARFAPETVAASVREICRAWSHMQARRVAGSDLFSARAIERLEGVVSIAPRQLQFVGHEVCDSGIRLKLNVQATVRQHRVHGVYAFGLEPYTRVTLYWLLAARDDDMQPWQLVEAQRPGWSAEDR